MSLTRDNVKNAVKYTFVRTDKDTEIEKAIQWILNDIADDFPECHGLEEATSTNLDLTEDEATLDISTALATQLGNRTFEIALIDSADEANNDTLDEISYDEYLDLLPDPTDTDDASKGYPYCYARRENTLYFYDVPDYTTLSIRIDFGKAHPTTGNILYPDDFEECIVNGVLWKMYDMMDDTKGRALKYKVYYHGADEDSGLKFKKIRSYMKKPNQRDIIKPFW